MDAFGNNSADNPMVSFPAADNRMQVATNGYTYDAVGNVIDTGLIWAGGHHYTYDGAGQLTQVDYGSTATYTYDAQGARVSKNVGGTWNEYFAFAGVPIAEKHMDGTWSDFIYAGGQKIARAETQDTVLHLSGVNATVNNQPRSTFVPLSLNGASNYTVQAGDVLRFRQYSHNATGGIMLWFSNGSISNGLVDLEGQSISQDLTEDQWHLRTVALTGQSLNVTGANITAGFMINETTAPGK